MKTKLISILIISIMLTACMPGLSPAPSAYPAPIMPTSTKQKIITTTPTKQIESSTPRALATWSTYTPRPTSTQPFTVTPLPTRWRDFTPTPNSASGVWPKFSSEITYAYYSRDYERVVGPLYFTIAYPSDWYLYPGYTVVYPGVEWQGTYIQNYERTGETPEEPPLTPGKVFLDMSALPCDVTVEGCPVDLQQLSPNFPGTKRIQYQSDYNFTHWEVFLYVKDMQFGLHGYMSGTPEENAELIKTLDEILASVKLW